MQKRHLLRASAAAAIALSTGLAVLPAVAQDNVFKIGLILPMTGQQATTGRQIEAAARLYMAQNGDTVAGKKVQLIIKDDTSLPDVTRRLAQELVVNEKVNVLAGMGITPSAMATAPLATQSQPPGGDGRRHLQHHRGIALRGAHQLHAAASLCGLGRLGPQERHQKGGHAGERLRPRH